MIRFSCPHCGQKLTVPDGQAGRADRCPRCTSRITIPPRAGSAQTAISEELLAAPPVPTDADRAGAAREDIPSRSTVPPSDALDRQLLDLPPTAPQMRLSDEEILAKLKFQPPPEYTGARRLPWPIDILLYAANVAGLTNLALVIGIPLLLTLLQRAVFLPFLGLMFFLAKLAVGLYAAWYWAECTRDSAQGGTRAVQILDAAGYGEKWSRVSYLLAVYAVFALPAALYFKYRGSTDVFFWILVAWGAVFFPMGLLAIIVNDGLYVLNPLFLLSAIRRVFFPYVGLLLLAAAGAAAFGLIHARLPREMPSIWLNSLGLLLALYLSLVAAHVLGRFYWRYRERLAWDT
jgi:DNA-directed RNA polymerase subunit RPC12/RpoP